MKRARRRALGALLSLAGLALPARAAEAPQTVLVGTYTDKESRGIYRFRFDDATGALAPDGTRRVGLSMPRIAATTASRSSRWTPRPERSGAWT